MTSKFRHNDKIERITLRHRLSTRIHKKQLIAEARQDIDNAIDNLRATEELSYERQVIQLTHIKDSL